MIEQSPGAVSHAPLPSRLERLRAALERPVDSAGLAVFRFGLGMIVAVSAIRFLAYGWVDEYFVDPDFFFRYWGFSWVPLPSPEGVHALFYTLFVLGVMSALGLFHRLSTSLLFIGFTYVQLLDQTNYLNHYYLVTLLLGLSTWMPLGRAWSLETLLRPDRRHDHLPAWMLYLLRFQIGCVYVFAGKAKLSTDWLLHAQPLNIWLSSRTDTPWIGWLFDRWETALAFSWGGFLFDSTIVVFLCWARTRPFAYLVVLVFHFITGTLFPIGMFPVIMVFGALIFFPSSWPRDLSRRLRLIRAPDAAPPLPRRRLSSLAIAALGLYCAFQALFPLRMHLYALDPSGLDVLWRERGMRFAWKVMVREKNGAVVYRVVEEGRTRPRLVTPRDWLDARQAREMSTQPDLILQLAHAIGEYEARLGRDVSVYVDAIASLNGRRPHHLIDPDVDLMTVEDTIWLPRREWVLPPPTEPPPRLEPPRRH